MKVFSSSNLMSSVHKPTRIRTTPCPSCGEVNASNEKHNEFVWVMCFHCRKCGLVYTRKISECDDIVPKK